MDAKGIVDILLEDGSSDPEAAEFYKQHLLADPSHLFTGPDTWDSAAEFSSDGSYGENFDSFAGHCRIFNVVFTHPTGDWTFRSVIVWKRHLMQHDWIEMGPDIIAKTDEDKFRLMDAITDWNQVARETMDTRGVDDRTGPQLHRYLCVKYKTLFDGLPTQ